MAQTVAELSIDHQSSVPLHAQAETLLRRMIKMPQYRQEGNFLPREVELAKTWGISRNTLRQAIAKLLLEGNLERKTGVGTKVVTKRISTSLDNWMSFTQEMTRKNLPMLDFFVEAKWIKANETVAAALGIETGKKLLLLKRVKGFDNKPVVYFESYIHPRIGIGKDENFHTSLYELLEEKFHIIPVLSKEEIKAEKAGKDIAKLLKVEQNDPVLERVRLVLDINKKPVEYCYAYYRYDMFTYTIDIKRNI